MHIEAATYNAALEAIAKLQDDWQQDFAKVEQLIDQKKEKGEAYAGLEMNLRKGQERLSIMMRFFNAADAYINAMEAEAERKAQIIVSQSVQLHSSVNTSQRTTIADMPVNNKEYLLEIIQRLDSIEDKINPVNILQSLIGTHQQKQTLIRHNSNSAR